MISKQMYRILKEIPHSPSTTTFKDVESKHLVDINLLKDLLNDAKDNQYIAFTFRNNPYNDILQNNFALTELGQTAIEEYEGTKYNSKLSTWALIISTLSFVASVVAIIVSCVVP